MIKFMLLAAPRSGTTWASNWLTTDTTLCLHDPLFTMHYTEIDNYPTTKYFGVSCTGLAMFDEWINNHPATKIILHRNIDEVNRSLANIGLPGISQYCIEKLESINGIHLPWTDLFDRPKFIYEKLLQKPFDEERHALLKEIEMQPNFEGLTIEHGVTRRLVNEIHNSMKGN